MINSKKLKAFSFYAFLFLFLIACSSKPVTEIYTLTGQASLSNETAPFIILKDQSLLHSTNRNYLKIAKAKNPDFKSFIIMTEHPSDEIFQTIENNILLIDVFVLHYPVEPSLLVRFKRPIVNSSILDLKDENEFFAEKETLRFFRYDYKNEIFILSFPAPNQLIVNHEDPYRFYFEDAVISTLRLRKDLKKVSSYKLIMITSNDLTTFIQNEIHPHLLFSNYVLNHPNFFLIGKNKVQFCHWFFKATKDCFEENNGNEDLDFLNERKKLLEQNSEKIEAMFFDEKIESPNI